MSYITVEVSAYEALGQLSDEDLISEIKERKLDVSIEEDTLEIIEKIYINRRLGLEYNSLLDQLFYSALGKIV